MSIDDVVTGGHGSRPRRFVVARLIVENWRIRPEVEGLVGRYRGFGRSRFGDGGKDADTIGYAARRPCQLLVERP